MEEYLSQLQKNPLFRGVSEENVKKLYNCIAAHERMVEKDSFVFRAGDEAQRIYLNLTGNMHIVDEDFWGNRSIIETMSPITLFGEAYNLSSSEKYLVSVIAAEDSILLEIDPERLFEICPNGCACHTEVVKNTLFILSEKIVRLTRKLGHIIQRTTREKLLSYLSQCARQAQCNSFYIPYTRQQLADYLCVDRSALSHELSKMYDAGIVEYRKNHFELLEK